MCSVLNMETNHSNNLDEKICVRAMTLTYASHSCRAGVIPTEAAWSVRLGQFLGHTWSYITSTPQLG